MGFNASKHVEELREAGVPDKQAEAQVRLLNDVIDSDLATKRDLKKLENELKRDIKELELRLTLKLGSLLIVGIDVIATLVNLL